MDSDPTPPAPPALVIAGMHRSGTSLAASLLADAGVWIGNELVPAASGNPRGHFEDVDFFRLHQRMLAAAGLGQEGFTCQPGIAVPTAARAAAADLIEQRRQAGRTWGWKDPRTTLFLDFWAELVPEARFVFIVRPPWEVADSLFRRGDEAFALNPRLAVDVWVAYNRRVLDFVRGHRDRCVVVETAGVAADPSGFVTRMATLLGVPLAQPAPRFEHDLLVTRHAPHRRDLVHATQPEALKLLAELRDFAGATPTPAAGAGPSEVVDAALTEWAALAAATKALAGRERAAAEQSEALTFATSQLEMERLTGQQLAERAANLTRTVEQLTAALAAERATANVLRASQREELAALNSRLAAERAAARETSSGHLTEIADLKSQLAAERSAVALQADRAERAIRRQEQGYDPGLNHDAALDREDAARLAAQLQAEREIFESLRQDLVAQLDAALAANGTPPSAAVGAAPQRRSLGARLVAEGRRFARRVGSRRAA